MPNSDNRPSDEIALTPGRTTGLEAFRGRVREVIELAARQDATELWFCDADFDAWPLGERAVIDSLSAWARPGRSLRLLAVTFDVLVRHQPRFVEWRRRYDHLIQARVCATQHRSDLPSVVWSARACLHRLEPLHHTSVFGTEAARLIPLRQQLDEFWDAGRPAFAATTLGL